jgi:phosphatidylglycerol---prolipoprotein diacylglyceryl transferase
VSPATSSAALLSPAVVVLSFDPVLEVGRIAIRWETLGIALATLLGLVVAALIAGRTPRLVQPGHLRRDDLLFVVLGATPGAVVGGRIGYVLLHLDWYSANPRLVLDAASGGFELSLAVAGGVLTGLIVVRILEGTTGPWSFAAALPILLVAAGGKVATALGGTGQGAASDAAWATAYAGPGPWGSLAPSVPSLPSQLVEAVLMGLVLVLLAIAVGTGRVGRDGRLLGAALIGFALVRALVAFGWRDAAVVGPFRAEHALALVPFAMGVACWGAARRSLVVGRRAPGSRPGDAVPSTP